MQPSLLDKKNTALVRDCIPDQKTLTTLADFFATFSDATRIKILTALAVSNMCVGDLALILGLNQTTLSHQLKLLKSAGLVTCLRQGKIVFYSLARCEVIDTVLCGGADYLSAR